MHLRELDANLIVILDALLLEASVTKAAERLGRSPSAVSHALARLREIFDDPLFVRAGQRLVPTSRATQLAPTVHIIVSGLEGLLNREEAFDPREQERRFTLACSDVFELTILPPLRADLAEAAPGLTLDRETQPGSIVDALRARRIDLAVVDGAHVDTNNDVSVQPLFNDPAVFLMPETESQPRAKDLAREEGPTVFADAAHARYLFANSEGWQPANLETVASPLVALLTAMERGGIALVPESAGTVVRRYARLAPVSGAPSLPSLPMSLIWHLSFERDPCHVWLRDRIMEHAAPERRAAQANSDPIETA